MLSAIGASRHKACGKVVNFAAAGTSALSSLCGTLVEAGVVAGSDLVRPHPSSSAHNGVGKGLCPTALQKHNCPGLPDEEATCAAALAVPNSVQPSSNQLQPVQGWLGVLPQPTTTGPYSAHPHHGRSWLPSSRPQTSTTISSSVVSVAATAGIFARGASHGSSRGAAAYATAAAAPSVPHGQGKSGPSASLPSPSSPTTMYGGRRRAAPLSPHAHEFQRRFFELINMAPEAPQAGARVAAAGAATAATASASNIQAIRMLLAWLEEGRAAAAAELQQQQQGRQQQQAAGSSQSSSAASSFGTAVAAPYRLEQSVLDRSMEVLWRLYHKEDLLIRKSASRGVRGREGDETSLGGGGADAMEATMSLQELQTAAETLAAAGPAMDLTFRKQHYDLLLELNAKRFQQDPLSRRGMLRKMLNVRQQMVQQMLPVPQVSLNHLLSVVRRDAEMSAMEKVATALRIIERDLPVVTAAPSSSSSAASSSSASAPASSRELISWPLQQTLHGLMKDAAREHNWNAYQKFEAVLVSRTRAVPPYDVLQALLCYACDDRRPDLAMGALAQMQQREADGPGGSQAAAAAVSGGRRGQEQPQGQGQGSQRWEWEREREALELRKREARAMWVLLRTGVEQGDMDMAEKAYQRLRTIIWRHRAGPAAAELVAWTDRAAAEAEATAAAAAAKAATDGSADGVASGEAAAATAAAAVKQQQAEEAEYVAAEGTDADVYSEEGHRMPDPRGPPPSAAAVKAVKAAAEKRPAPPQSTALLLELAIRQRSWPRVMDLVGDLAELEALARRSGNHVLHVMGERTGLSNTVSAYGGLRPLSDVLIQGEDETVSYYSELLRHVAAAAAGGTALAPFGGSPVPFGPPLRAAAARRDLASVSAIVKQMKGLGCPPGADAYAAVIEASLKAGKPERVPGLLDLMAEERVVPSPAVWEVALRAATEGGNQELLGVVAHRAVEEADRSWRGRSGVAGIDREVLSNATSAAEALGNTRASSALRLLADIGRDAGAGEQEPAVDEARDSRRRRRRVGDGRA